MNHYGTMGLLLCKTVRTIERKNCFTKKAGTLSVDDSVIDKPYSEPNKTELIDYFWEEQHKCSVKGINFGTNLEQSIRLLS